jgi:hypothetical protein
VDRAFEQVIGLPCWYVRRRRRCQIHMEFGAPHHRIEEVTDLLVSVPGLPPSAPRRDNAIEGEWHLWIQTRHWELSWRGSSIASSESVMPAIDKALAFHDGQAIERVTVDPANGATRFEFDLGCVLATWPRPEPSEYGREQWTLFRRSTATVFAVREDGWYLDAPDDTEPEGEPWRPLPATSPIVGA